MALPYWHAALKAAGHMPGPGQSVTLYIPVPTVAMALRTRRGLRRRTGLACLSWTCDDCGKRHYRIRRRCRHCRGKRLRLTSYGYRTEDLTF